MTRQGKVGIGPRVCHSRGRRLTIHLLLLRSPAVSGGHHFGWDFWVCDPFFNSTIEVVTFRLYAGCVFIAGIHPSRTWMSESLESVRLNACVHRLDLGLYSHSKEFGGNGARIHVNSKGKNPLYQKKISEEDRTHDAASSRTASPTHNQWAIPAPAYHWAPAVVSEPLQRRPRCCRRLPGPAWHRTNVRARERKDSGRGAGDRFGRLSVVLVD